MIFVYRLFCNAGHRPNGYEIAKKVLNVTVYDFGDFVLDKKINKNAPFAIQEIFFILSPFVLLNPDFSMES